MIDSWILSKLDPLIGRPVIILRDPQRMIISGAHVVDGWAEENGYTVLFCTGNLALREMAEAIRDDPDARILLVDRSRQGTLFYPDLAVRAGREAALSLSLREFLIEQTGDTTWPKLVDDRELSALLLEDLPAAVEAHRALRQVSPTRFSDSDLHKIALGAALKINPFRRLAPSEIRRLCIEQHAMLARLQGRLPEDAVATLRAEIMRAPKPFCWLLDHDPAMVMRAFTLAAILHQHGLDYGLLIANVDPLLHDYREIDPVFLDQAIAEQLTADPDRVLEDVRDVERALAKNPNGLALILRDQLRLDEPAQALAALKAERLSSVVRCLALSSLLADLITATDLRFHRSVLKELDGQEHDTALPVLRRPSEQMLALAATYRRAVEVIELMAVLAKAVKALKVADAAELDFGLFDKAWNQQRLNRLDFYLSDLDRLLRVGDILPIPINSLWKEMADRWAGARLELRGTIAAAEEALNLVNCRFQDFYRLHYTKWLARDDIPVTFTHQFLPRVFRQHWDPRANRKAVILVFDGLRTDAWDEYLRPVLEERFDLIESRPGSALLPTETDLSRKAISAGKLPVDFPKGSRSESTLLQGWFKEAYGFAPAFEIVRDSDTEASGMVVRYVSPQVEYIVFNFTDDNLHHNQNDLALIYRNVVREIVQQDVRAVLRELPDDTLIFVTSDHGFTPMPVATITVPSAITVDDRDVKYRNARTVQKLAPPDAEKTVVFDASVMGIPTESPSVRGAAFSFVLFPRPGYVFKRQKSGHDPDRYSHGGLSMAECLVPMAVYGPRQAQRLLDIVALRQTGSATEGEPLELEIVVEAGKRLEREMTFTLSFNVDEIPARREAISGQRKTITQRWMPRLPEITPELRDQGVIELPVSVVLSYYEDERLVRASKATDVRVKLDTTRLRRRIDSKLDLLMGKVPPELKG